MSTRGSRSGTAAPGPADTARTPGGDGIIGRIRERARDLLQLAAPLCTAHRARCPDPLILFNLRGQAAGLAVWRRSGRPLLRFNLDFARRHPEDFLETTVAHEVAHLVTTACHGRTRPHGPEWQAVMRHLGVCNPTRCHDYTLDESEIKRQRRWAYVCACSLHELSTTRHNRIRTRKASYHCRQCGGLLREASVNGDWPAQSA